MNICLNSTFKIMEDGGSGGGRKRRRKKTVVACLPCQRAHYSCEESTIRRSTRMDLIPYFSYLERPCASCVKRGKESACVDGMKKRAKYMEGNAGGGGSGGQEELMLLAQSVPRDEMGTNGRSRQDETRPFNYGQSYHRLLEMLQRRLSRESMTRVCRALASFRPTLIAQVRMLHEEDLMLMERSFQRSILELQRVLSLTGAPHCVWRRTGEICHTTREFCILSGWTSDVLIDDRLIFELFDEPSIITYWEEYARCVIDAAHTNFRITTSLFRPDGLSVPGALWVTVRKDIFDIPLTIVGCFLPDLWNHQFPNGSNHRHVDHPLSKST